MCEFLGNYQSVASKASESERQLKDDPDKAFLLASIKNGFQITNKGCKTAEAKSAEVPYWFIPPNRPQCQVTRISEQNADLQASPHFHNENHSTQEYNPLNLI